MRATEYLPIAIQNALPGYTVRQGGESEVTHGLQKDYIRVDHDSGRVDDKLSDGILWRVEDHEYSDTIDGVDAFNLTGVVIFEIEVRVNNQASDPFGIAGRMMDSIVEYMNSDQAIDRMIARYDEVTDTTSLENDFSSHRIVLGLHGDCPEIALSMSDGG